MAHTKFSKFVRLPKRPSGASSRPFAALKVMFRRAPILSNNFGGKASAESKFMPITWRSSNLARASKRPEGRDFTSLIDMSSLFSSPWFASRLLSTTASPDCRILRASRLGIGEKRAPGNSWTP